ncbi:MAG: zf-HC2 domain-containing protein [Acidobacteria bacterium]|nr:zf-HC2 domain-containing protein [Acidobacteriota bacterium]MBI3662015.1 zf-HC2 domain-containing protein [Acidobacteriota bacterium]
MVCKEYSERLDLFEDYIDGRLPVTEVAAVSAHLERCSACRDEMDSARLAGTLLRAGLEPTAEPGGAFWTRVRARLHEEEEKLRVAEFWPALEIFARRLSLISAAALLVLFGYLAGLEWRDRNLPTVRQTDSRDLFPEPVRQPADQSEVLVSLASNGNGR